MSGRSPRDPSGGERRVRLFRNGRNQAIRIPREFELAGHDAIVRKEGERLVIELIVKRGLLGLLATLRPIEHNFADPDAGLRPADDIKIEP